MIREFDLENDYPVLASWWERHGTPIIQKDRLPPTGFVFDGDLGPEAMVLMYLTNANVIWGEFLTAHPDVRGFPRDLAINSVLGALYDYSTKNNMALLCLSDSDKIKSRIESQGWKQIASNLDFFSYGG